MIHTAFFVLCVALIIIGVTDLIRFVVLSSLKSKDTFDSTTVIPIKGHDEQAEFSLRSAAAKIKWSYSAGDQRLICLDCGMDEETKKICELICSDYEFMDLKKSDEPEAHID